MEVKFSDYPAFQVIKEMTTTRIFEVIDNIKDLAPDIAIFEV